MAHTDRDDLLIPSCDHFGGFSQLSGQIPHILHQRIGSGADSKQERNLLNQPHHRVFSGISRRRKIVCPQLIEFFDCLFAYISLRLGKRNRNLMEPPDLPPNDLPEGTGNNRFVQNVAQHLRIVNVLRPLSDTEHCDFLRQVGRRE